MSVPPSGEGGGGYVRPLSTDAVFRIEVSLSSRKSSAIVMRTTARLYSLEGAVEMGGSPGDVEWKSVAYGAPCIQLMKEGTDHNAPFHIKIVIAEVESGIALWEAVVREASNYHAMQANFHTFSTNNSTFAIQFANEDEASRMLESLEDLFLQNRKTETVSFEKRARSEEDVFRKPRPIRKLNKKDISAPCNFKHVSGITLQRTQACEEELRGTIQRKLKSSSLSAIYQRRGKSRSRLPGNMTDGSVYTDEQPSPDVVRRRGGGGGKRGDDGEGEKAKRLSVLQKFGSLRLSRKKKDGAESPAQLRKLARDDERRKSLPTHFRNQTRPSLTGETFVPHGHAHVDPRSPNRALSLSSGDLHTVGAPPSHQDHRIPQRRATITSPMRKQQFMYTPYSASHSQGPLRGMHGIQHPPPHPQPASNLSSRPYMSDMSLNRVPPGYGHGRMPEQSMADMRMLPEHRMSNEQLSHISHDTARASLPQRRSLTEAQMLMMMEQSRRRSWNQAMMEGRVHILPSQMRVDPARMRNGAVMQGRVSEGEAGRRMPSSFSASDLVDAGVTPQGSTGGKLMSVPRMSSQLPPNGYSNGRVPQSVALPAKSPTDGPHYAVPHGGRAPKQHTMPPSTRQEHVTTIRVPVTTHTRVPTNGPHYATPSSGHIPVSVHTQVPTSGPRYATPSSGHIPVSVHTQVPTNGPHYATPSSGHIPTNGPHYATPSSHPTGRPRETSDEQFDRLGPQSRPLPPTPLDVQLQSQKRPLLPKYQPPPQAPTAALHSATQPQHHVTRMQHPATQFQPPVSQFQPMVSQFQPPVSQFKPPVSQFQPPVSQFQPPVSQFQPPVSQFQPMVSQFQQADIPYSQSRMSQAYPSQAQPRVTQPVQSNVSMTRPSQAAGAGHQITAQAQGDARSSSRPFPPSQTIVNRAQALHPHHYTPPPSHSTFTQDQPQAVTLHLPSQTSYMQSYTNSYHSRADTQVSPSHHATHVTPLQGSTPRSQSFQPAPIPVQVPRPYSTVTTLPATSQPQLQHTTSSNQVPSDSNAHYDILHTHRDMPGNRDSTASHGSASTEMQQYTDQMSRALEQFDSLLAPKPTRHIMQTSL